MFLQNVGICRQVYTAPKPRRITCHQLINFLGK
jgi:hypothetical protein